MPKVRPVPVRPRRNPPPAWEPPAWLVLAAPPIAAAIVHGAGVFGFFAADDLEFLARVRGLSLTPWGWSRPLPGRLRWEAFTAIFGVHPLPHLLLAWLLHAASALLVARVALLAGLGRWPALVAGVLAGATAVAYTSTHWASGLGEVMAAAFALVTLVLHLECRRRTRPALAWLAGAGAIATVASKESAMLLPFAVWALDRLGLGRGEGRGALREIGVLGALAAAAVIIAWRVAPPLAGEAYAFGATPLVWLENQLTYCAWVVRIFDPVRDRSATLQPALAPVGVVVLAMWCLAAWSERRASVRPVTAGLVWFLLMLAPVVPLANHTYLYYLVAPFAGVALAAGVLLVGSVTWLAPRAAPAILALALAADVANETMQVRTRGTLLGAGVLVDRVARESELLRNAVGDLGAAGVTRGDTIVLVNPYPMQSVDPTTNQARPAGSGFGAHAYIPFVVAIHDGRAVPLLRPGVTVLGIGDGLPPEWARARTFRFANDGHLTDLGRGTVALDSLSVDYLRGERWADARATCERLLALGVDNPEIRWRLGVALAGLGDIAGVTDQARAIVQRWPESGRAAQLIELVPSPPPALKPR